MRYNYNNFEIRLLDKNNKQELEEVQKLRYEYLKRDFNPELPEGGIDDDGYDKYADLIIVKDMEKNIIVGTYRVATKKTVNGHPFVDEDEFNIDSIKNLDCEILELGRAVVHKDYRNGTVIQLLWAAISDYAYENNCKYIFGTTSLHGIDPSIYKNLLCYLKKEYSFEYDIFARKNAYEFDYVDEYDMEKVNEELPNLLKAYMKMGLMVARNGYIDYNFNCCDIFTIGDTDKLNNKFFERLKKFLK